MTIDQKKKASAVAGKLSNFVFRKPLFWSRGCGGKFAVSNNNRPSQRATVWSHAPGRDQIALLLLGRLLLSGLLLGLGHNAITSFLV
jgi:hypothetical protein